MITFPVQVRDIRDFANWMQLDDRIRVRESEWDLQDKKSQNVSQRRTGAEWESDMFAEILCWITSTQQLAQRILYIQSSFCPPIHIIINLTQKKKITKVDCS